MSGQRLLARDLRLTYRDPGGDVVQAVDLASLEAHPGSMTGLAGPSGSGKSTLLHLLSGLALPDVGSVIWNDQDLASLGEGARDRWRRRHAGFIFQGFHLIDEMSALDNVLVPGWFDRWSVTPLRDRAQALLAGLRVPDGRRHAALLSRGEQQRVAIARALLLDPPIIFADEPTASLDERGGRLVIDRLLALAGEEGRTVLVASHDQALLAACGRIHRIEHGRLVAGAA